MDSEELLEAPLFSKFKEVPPGTSAMRLPLGYNMNHKYFYETYNWDLYNLHEFAEMTSQDSKEPVIVPSARDIPAISLGFPIHYKLKPWYWWSRFFVNANQIWQDIRLTMPRSQEQYGYDLLPGAM